MVKIGVFDSGIGGQTIADKIQRLFPSVEVLSVNDSKNIPYGLRRRAEIIRLTLLGIQPLLDAHCDAIVIACNTATTNAIDELRSTYPHTHFVGIEPMIKPAARHTKTGTIAVLATPSTLASHRYALLKQRWAERITVIEPDCSTWADTIEHGHADQIDIHGITSELRRWKVDTIVLGCTHYHWIEQEICDIVANRATVLQPEQAVVAQLERVLAQL